MAPDRPGEGTTARTEKRPRKHLTEQQKLKNNFLAGATSLSLSFAIMHPLDTFKCQLQARVGSRGSPPDAAGSTPGAIRGIFTRQLWRDLGRGFTASVSGAAPQGGARLCTYEWTKQRLLNPTSSPVLVHLSSVSPGAVTLLSNPYLASALAAVVGDLASSIVKVPREVITSRLQTSSSSFAAVTKDILQTEGFAGLFRGFWSTTARDCPFMVILFCTYEGMKRSQWGITQTPLLDPRAFSHPVFAPPPEPPSTSPGAVPPPPGTSGPLNDAAPPPRPAKTAHHPLLDLPTSVSIEQSADGSLPDQMTITTLKSTLFGAVSGCFAGFMTTPMDVIKTKIMTSPGGASAASMAQVVRTIVASQTGAARLSVFWTGGLARSTWWLCVTGIFFPCYENVKEKLRIWSETES